MWPFFGESLGAVRVCRLHPHWGQAECPGKAEGKGSMGRDELTAVGWALLGNWLCELSVRKKALEYPETNLRPPSGGGKRTSRPLGMCSFCEQLLSQGIRGED